MKIMNRRVLKFLIAPAFLMLFFPTGRAHAHAQECEITYDGKICIRNKVFSIEKLARIKDESHFVDKLLLGPSDLDKVLEFRITVKNIGDVKTDKMKMQDFLPSELKRVGGHKLEETWDSFDISETKTFIIEVKLDPNEIKDKEFEKCVVNKAEVRFDGNFEGADTATVCYGVSKITELPETGFGEIILPLGTGFLAAGYLLKKFTRK